MEIKKITLDDILPQFKERAPLLNTPIEAPSVFIGSMGFEDRSPALFRYLAEKDSLREAKCVILVYSTNKHDNERTLPLFEEYKDKVKELIFLPYLKGRLGGDIRELLGHDNKVIYVDISTLASYCFYPLLFELFNTYEKSNISIFYSEAKRYQPSYDEWTAFLKKYESFKTNRSSLFDTWDETYFQTTEVDHVYESQLFPGVNPDPLSEALIAVPNFATVRMRTFITRFQETPGSDRDSIYWIFGRPPAADKKWRLNAIKQLHMREPYNSIEKAYEACTLDYKDIWRQFEEIWRKTHLNYHLTIATLGSKMQHLGTFFFLLMHPEVTLLLSEPKEYVAKQYSEEIEDCWVINLGNIKALKKVIASHGTLQEMMGGSSGPS